MVKKTKIKLTRIAPQMDRYGQPRIVIFGIDGQCWWCGIIYPLSKLKKVRVKDTAKRCGGEKLKCKDGCTEFIQY